MIDLNAPTASATKQIVSTDGTQRVDKIALTTDGSLLIADNTSDDPPFATLFVANGDAATSAVTKITKITVDPIIIPAGLGLGLKSPTWEPRTQRIYVLIRRLPTTRRAAITGSWLATSPVAEGCW